jgi:hypothetical protein
MSDDFEKRFQAMQDMCKAIAQIELDNWFVLTEYEKVQKRIAEIKEQTRKKFGGKNIASEDLIRNKVNELKEEMDRMNLALPKSKRKETKRITGPMKVQVLRAMLKDFESNGVEKVTLEDIERWCAKTNRKGASEILNDLGIGDVAVPSTQFFQTTMDGKPTRLYPDEAYETQSPPFPARFLVKRWRAWLEKQTFSEETQRRRRTVK